VKWFSSRSVHTTGKPCSSVDTSPATRRVKGTSSYSQRQKPGIWGLGMVTPQKREKTTMTKGFMRTAMKVLGVRAEMVWPRVTEKSSVTRTERKK